MNVSGPAGLARLYGLPAPVRPRAAPAPAAPAAPAAEVGVLAPAPMSYPSVDGVPPGSDPALWAVLTAEERSFFVRQAALGPLSYRPGTPASPRDASAPLGQRLDVRA